MTIINPNSIAGITSVTAEAGVMNFYKSDGTLAGLQLNGVNFNTTAGVSTFNDVYVGGTITYEDVKNVDSVGIVTARAGVKIPDGQNLTLGTDGDVGIKHQSGHFEINNSTGNTYFQTNGQIRLRGKHSGSTEEMIIATAGSSVDLYYDNSKKLETSSTGIDVTGNIGATGEIKSLTLFESTSGQDLRLNAGSANRDIFLQVNDSTLMTVRGSTGNVGINDTTPDTRLSVNSGTTDVVGKFTSTDAKAWIQFRDNSTTDTGVMIGAEGNDMMLRAGSNERVRITSSGNFGVGTDSPNYKTVIQVSDTTAYSASTISSNQFQLAISNSGANGVAGILLATEPSSGNGGHCGIRALSTGNGNSDLTFSTRGSSTSAERLRITSAGLVGIGTDVSGGGGAYGRLSVVIPSQSGGSALQVMNSAAGSSDGDLTNIVLRSVNNLGTQWAGAEYRAHEHIFKNQGTDALRITSAGLVGVNCTPVGMFEVQKNGVPAIIANYNNQKHLQMGAGGSGAGFHLTDGNFFTINHQPYANRGTDNNLSERLRIDSSGRLLIGTTTEGHADADDLTIATSGSTGITLRSATNGAGSIFFSDATSGVAEYDGFVQFYHSDKHFRLGINNDEKLRVTSGGTLVLGDPESASASGLIHLYQASNDPYIYIQRGSGDSATTIGGIFFKNSTNNLGLISVRSSDINDGSMKFSTMNAGTLGEKLIIQPSGNLDVYANTVHLYNNTDTANTYFYAQNTSSGNAGIKMKNNQGEWTIIANDRLRFIDDDAGSERLSIENDGNVKVWNGGRITILSANNNGQTSTLLKIGSQGNGSETRAIDMDGNWSTNESKSITYTHGSGATNMIAQMNVQYINPGSRFRWGKLYHSGDSSTYTMLLTSISTTQSELKVVGKIVANSNPSNYIPLACQPTQGNTGCFIGQSQAYNTAYSLLPWTNGGTYISSGVYYDNSSWVHRSQGNDNCLLYFKGSGWAWYSSNNGSSSWNVSNNTSIMNSAGQWTGGTSSDRRLKDNITNMSTSDALTKVSQLQGVSYTWKDEVQKKFGTGPYPEGTHYGFIAQDVKTVWPEAHIITQTDNESDFDEDPTHDVKDDVYYGEIEGVKMEKMVPLLVEAIKELKKENDALKARVTTLESS